MPYDNWKIGPERFTGNILDAVGFDGTKTKIGSLPKINGKKVTRHHIIDIMTLQDVWNQACEYMHGCVIEALCNWAGCPPRQQVFFLANTGVIPSKLIQAICWNPFNIVVGPGSTERKDNPGDHEFDYIAFVAKPNLTVAQQEFNTHVKCLRKIEQYMKMYCNMEKQLTVTAHLKPIVLNESDQLRLKARDDAVNRVTISSLIELLESDRPEKYPTLYRILCSQVPPTDAAINVENDNKRPHQTSAYSLSYLPGCLIDPSLWSDDQLTSPARTRGAVVI